MGWRTTWVRRKSGVQSHDGVVTLNGSVPNYANRLAAQQAAYRVTGIADVVNDIRAKPLGAKMSESSAIVAVSEPLKAGTLLPPMRIENPDGKAATP